VEGLIAGQSISLSMGGNLREYSIASGSREPLLSVCVRLISGGVLSPVLCAAAMGERCAMSGPHGCFMFQESERAAVVPLLAA
jgi:ferredoxin-NADP reductase